MGSCFFFGEESAGGSKLEVILLCVTLLPSFLSVGFTERLNEDSFHPAVLLFDYLPS